MKTPIISREVILESAKFLHLKVLTLTHPNGNITPYEVASRNHKKIFGIVSILPITSNNEVVLIRQYRAPLDRIQIELPAGCAEIGRHDTLEDAVRAELLEETGYQAGILDPIATFSSSSGMTDETVHGYIGQHCTKVTDILALDGDEYIDVLLVPISEFDQLILSEMSHGNIIEPKMLAMMWWFQNSLAKK